MVNTHRAAPVQTCPEQTADLTIRNDVAELVVVSDRLEQMGIELGVSLSSLVQLQVALDEIACNVIEHGWPDGGDHQLHVRIIGHNDRIEIEIDDDGQAFDPSRPPPPRPRRPSGRRMPGGVGLHLAKQLVDRLDYERHGGRNRTVIIKRYAARRTAN